MSDAAELLEYGGFAGSRYVLSLPDGERIELPDEVPNDAAAVELARRYLQEHSPGVPLCDRVRLVTM